MVVVCRPIFVPNPTEVMVGLVGLRLELIWGSHNEANLSYVILFNITVQFYKAITQIDKIYSFIIVMGRCFCNDRYLCYLL